MSGASTSRPRRARTALTSAGLVGALALGACGDGDDPGPDSTSATPSVTTSATTAPAPSTPAPSESSSPSPTAELPEGFTTEEQRSPSWPRLGSRVGIGTAVRVGRHSAYDRVVYEFSGRGRPTYRVTYVDEPKDSVSGDRVEVPGEAYLLVGVTSVATPEEDYPIPTDPSDAALENTVVTYAPAIWGGFEGVGEQFIGVRGEQRPFRVSVLENPTRLVVDIAR